MVLQRFLKFFLTGKPKQSIVISSSEGNENMTKEATKNYTEAQELALQEAADKAGGQIDNALAEVLAAELDKDVRSIRAKAVRMGLYKAKAKVSKTGDKVETKDEIAADIGQLVGRNMESLAKASKEDLKALRQALQA